MKKILQAALVATLLLSAQADAFGQRESDTDRYFDESQGFTHRLWYGGGVQLGFSGGTFSSIFQIGISPMVGYKFTENLSAGPRLSLLYSHYRQQTGFNTTVRANMIDYGVGAFARYKVIRGFFVHLEYGADNEEFPTTSVLPNGELETIRQLRNNAYVGVGYNNSAGLWGYDIYILYNTLLAENSPRSPFELRFGVTYNF